MAWQPRDLATVLYRAAAGQDKREAAETVARFVRVLLARPALSGLLSRVLEALPIVADEAEGTAHAVVEAARRPSDADVERALAALGLDPAATETTFRTVPETLGGFRVRTADRVLDLTAERRLKELGRAIGASAKT
jgi:F0F1-type ATP synthase delta subunit